MMEWLALLLLIPAIVVPVVLLFGFAGCDLLFNLDHVHPTAPLITTAEGISLRSIRLQWTDSGSGMTYTVERIDRQTNDQRTFDTHVVSIVDYDLEPDRLYQYRVKAVRPDGEESEWSHAVEVRTLGFRTAFQAVLSDGDAGWEGCTLVQRIEPSRLLESGTVVRISLLAAPLEGVSIDRMFISQPAAAGDPYDPGPDIGQVFTSPVVLKQGEGIILREIVYTLDRTRPLLIAADIAPGVPSSVGVLTQVSPQEAATYRHPGAEASLQNRQPGYEMRGQISLVTKIEVA